MYGIGVDGVLDNRLLIWWTYDIDLNCVFKNMYIIM